MAKKFRITETEVKKRVGYLLLGVVAYYLVDPFKLWVDANLPNVNPWFIGLGGLVLVLYFFDFE